MSRRRHRRKPMSEINVVPYIDVMLVLLVVFMVTAPMLMEGVEVDLPEAPSKPLDEQETEPLIVSLRSDGTYYLNLGEDPEKALPLDEVVDKVEKILKNKPETRVLVWGDQSSDYGTVVHLMARLQGAGAGTVGLVTESPGPT